MICLSVCQPMETADGDVQFRPRTGKAASAPLLPEVEAYLQLLLVVHLTNNKRYTEVCLFVCLFVCLSVICLLVSLSVCVCLYLIEMSRSDIDIGPTSAKKTVSDFIRLDLKSLI